MLNRRSVRIFAAGGNSSGDFRDAKDDVGRASRPHLRVRDVRRRLEQQPEVAGGAGEGGAAAAGSDAEAEGAGRRPGEAPRPAGQGAAGAAGRAAADADRAAGSAAAAEAGFAAAAVPVEGDAADEPGAHAELDAGAERARDAGLGERRSGADSHPGPGPAEAPRHRLHGRDPERPDRPALPAAAGSGRARQLPGGRRPGQGADHPGYLEEVDVGAAGPAEVADSASLITAPPFIT